MPRIPVELGKIRLDRSLSTGTVESGECEDEGVSSRRFAQYFFHTRIPSTIYTNFTLVSSFESYKHQPQKSI